MQFNKEQLEAINHKDGACVVIAGAGSGKTTVLTHRIKKLVDSGVNQNDILAVSFTKNTANDLEAKLKELNCKNVNVGTFHKVCGAVLKNEGLHFNDSLKVWDYENKFKEIDPKPNVKDILNFISYQKNCNVTCEEKDKMTMTTDRYTLSEMVKFYKAYEKLRLSKNALEFDDLLLECSKVNKDSKYTYKYLLVDEHQDCNIIKNILIKQFCPSGNIFVVGDYRQSIYGFNGSTPEQFMYFYKEFKNTKIINLDTNYRSNLNIVQKSNNFIHPYFTDYEHYSDSKSESDKVNDIQILTSYNKENEAVEIVNIIDELLKSGENPNEIAVLYRLNSHSINIEACLRDRDIDYEISNNGSFFKRKEVEIVMSVLRLIVNPHDNEALDTLFKDRICPLQFFSNDIFAKIRKQSALNNMSYFEVFSSNSCFQKQWQKNNANTFSKYIQTLRLQQAKNVSIPKMIDNIIEIFDVREYLETKFSSDAVEDRMRAIDILKSFAKGNNLENFINYIYKINTKKKKDNTIKLMSIHKSKGLEFKHVFVISIEDGKFPHEKCKVLEEARLFYVAITRAKEYLYLSQIGNDNKFVREYVN